MLTRTTFRRRSLPPGISRSTASANARAPSRESRYAHSSCLRSPGSAAIAGAWWRWKASGAVPEIRSAIAPAADAWWSSIDTVSNSEGGFERVYQGSALLLSWPMRLAPGETRRYRVAMDAAVVRDQAEGE